jgi:hypothetical protein
MQGLLTNSQETHLFYAYAVSESDRIGLTEQRILIIYLTKDLESDFKSTT